MRASVEGAPATSADDYAAASASDREKPASSAQIEVSITAKMTRLSTGLSPVTLKREEWTLPDSIPFGNSVVVPLRAGTTMQWKLVDRFVK